MRAHSYHGVGKRCRNSDYHPPYYTLQKLPAFSSHQTADQLAVQLCDVEAKQRANHQEHAMANYQSGFLALPTRYDNLQQPPQGPQKLAVQFDPFSHGYLSLAQGDSWALAGSRLVEGRSFLLRYRISNAINQSNGKSEIDSSRYFGTMLQIEFRQRENHSVDGLVRGSCMK